MHWHGLATFAFGREGPVVASPVREGLSTQIQDIFVRGVRPVVMLARGFEGLHASAVLERRGVVALCANSGTGKSTLALAVASLGAGHFADDALVYRVEQERAVCVKLPFPIRVDDDTVHRPDVAASDTMEPESAPLHRVYHLVRDGSAPARTPRFHQLPPPRAFEVLLSHAHPFDMSDGVRRREFIEQLLILARTVGVWECRFAPALDALPSLASALRAHADR
jgi:hypothetical protein